MRASGTVDAWLHNSRSTTTAPRLPQDWSETDPHDPPWATPADPDQTLTDTETNQTLVCRPLSALLLVERDSPHVTT